MFTPLFTVSDLNHEIPALHRQLDALLSGWSRPRSRSRSGPRARAGGLAIDVYDEGDTYRLIADVPGFAADDFEVEVTEDGLTIRGERKVAVPEGYTVHRRERGATRVARSLSFPTKLDPSHVDATLERGVLTITLAKRADAKPRSITVRSAA